MNTKIITIAMAIMIGLTGYSTYTMNQQQATIAKLRADVDVHTRENLDRALLGPSDYRDNQGNTTVMATMAESSICLNPSKEIVDVCDLARDYAKDFYKK